MKASISSRPNVPTPLTSCASPNNQEYRTVIDETTLEKISFIINSEFTISPGKSRGEIIGQVSSTFLNTPYIANTLIGSPDEAEALVADFNGVDCFTLTDYVEALSQSQDQTSFLKNLVKTRYIDCRVTYLTRRHFFTDWSTKNPHNTLDVTADISPNYVTVNKQLNHNPQGGEYVKGLGVIPRKINFIPGNLIDTHIISHLKTGDYVGVYSPLEGLDVSHVGIAIHKDNALWFRNASSLEANRKVVDSPFLEYMRSKPGMVVLRSL
ncbi:DUF1460 domain-containing protein [Pectobacterium versatile]|uniref:DUF1460 domain-containing protein n=1 Tax=Pectobacterium versatile TaxID=2488639 RepID=UPI001CD0BD65|nr:DUF1460 domain-containing protein [Pectobacterium versatile]